jgi:hypothetical protein
VLGTSKTFFDLRFGGRTFFAADETDHQKN